MGPTREGLSNLEGKHPKPSESFCSDGWAPLPTTAVTVGCTPFPCPSCVWGSSCLFLSSWVCFVFVCFFFFETLKFFFLRKCHTCIRCILVISTLHLFPSQLHILFISPPSLIRAGQMYMGYRGLPVATLLTESYSPFHGGHQLPREPQLGSGVCVCESHLVQSGIFNWLGLCRSFIVCFVLLALLMSGILTMGHQRAAQSTTVTPCPWGLSSQPPDSSYGGGLFYPITSSLGRVICFAPSTDLLWFECSHPNSFLNAILFVMC